MNILNRIRRLLGRTNPAGPRFIISRGYRIDSPFPQYDRDRPFRILRYLETRHLLKPGMLRRPRPVSLKRLRAVHDAEYLRSLQEPQAMEPVLGFPLPPDTQDHFLAFQRLMCGGTLLAARSALERQDIAVNLGGGLHHAARNRGSGFCVFNDVAVAINHVRELGHDFPILVIDLDLHDGDGTRSIFASDPTVFTFSIHNRDLGEVNVTAATTVALGGAVDDDTYLAAVRTLLPPVMADVQPGLVFYLAGSDPCVDDRLGDWKISSAGMRERDRLVMDLVRPQPGRVAVPTVILLAGGYGPTAWRHGAAFFSWLLTGDSRLDIPLEMELPLDHYRRLARLMKHPGLLPGEQTTEARGKQAPHNDWGLTEADLGAAGAPAAKGGGGLFLGLYSQHGVEMILDESGLLEQLRQRGFQHLALVLDLSDPLGHTLRIVSGQRQPLVVMEVKLRIARDQEKTEPDLLVVEWLLVQDAREEAPANVRPLLPGQDHPGMGLLRDLAAVLIVAAEKLDLDGLAFTPSQYHMAQLAHPQGRFPEPDAEARYLAIEKAVAGLDLQSASAAVAAGRVRDSGTGEVVAWEPRVMIIPVRQALRAKLHGDEFQRSVAAAARDLSFRLAV